MCLSQWSSSLQIILYNICSMLFVTRTPTHSILLFFSSVKTFQSFHRSKPIRIDGFSACKFNTNASTSRPSVRHSSRVVQSSSLSLPFAGQTVPLSHGCFARSLSTSWSINCGPVDVTGRNSATASVRLSQQLAGQAMSGGVSVESCKLVRVGQRSIVSGGKREIESKQEQQLC